MNTDKRRLELDELTRQIIGCVYTVSNSLGSGFLEKVYENALAIELRKAGLDIEQQRKIQVYYENISVGEFFADLVVGDSVIIELKVAKGLDENHYAQCLNYLKATGFTICLLVNFGKPKAEIKRIANQF
ncbi:MAG: GxxExxY protein [Sulfuricella sp.]|nr:GxxExxY protein [Sulfuricella sp.]